jgi:hypothetical protein
VRTILYRSHIDSKDIKYFYTSAKRLQEKIGFLSFFIFYLLIASFVSITTIPPWEVSVYTMSHHIDLPYDLILHGIYDLLSAKLQGHIAILCHNPQKNVELFVCILTME